MTHYWLHFTLKSDATFGRGDGIAGLVDREVEHDRNGLPFLRGRTLKGLLREEADNLLFALSQAQENSEQLLQQWHTARDALFGQAGSDYESAAIVHYGHARLPQRVREEVAGTEGLDRQSVLASITALRRQTAVGEDGVPVDGSLRTMRIILRETPFIARLQCARPLTNHEEALLGATVLAWRRAGTGRNRGRGRLQADLLNDKGASILSEAYRQFVVEGLQ